MSMRRTAQAFALGAALGLFGVAGAMAQNPPAYGPGYGYYPCPGMWPGMMGGGYGYGPGPGMGPRGPAMIDIDGDGIISADEAAAHAEARFDHMDADGDGQLTLDEFMAARMGRGPGYGPAAQRRQQAREARFRELDADASGTISKEEFMEWHKERYASITEDGEVTPWEFRASMRPL
jgi:Ca2+-binding EF-hand superfamily protein